MPKPSLVELQPRTILVRSTNWIGDAIMTTPAVRTIRQNFPDSHITLLAKPWLADVFKASPHVDEIMVYDNDGRHKGWTGVWQLGMDLRQRHFDAAILLQNAFEAAVLAWLGGIAVRAGYRRDGRSPLLSHGVTIRPETRKIHQVHYYQTLLQDLGLQPGSDELFLALAEEDKAWAASFCEQLPQPLVGINPGAAFGPAKCWPAERYGQLAARLHQRFGCHCLVFGTAADASSINEIVGHGPAFISGLAGKTSLTQAMALIDRCDAFVSNDSGLMHVGAALHRPMVAIFGSTDHIATGPFSDQAQVVRKDIDCQPCLKKECKRGFDCMLNITVADVEEPMAQILAAG